VRNATLVGGPVTVLAIILIPPGRGKVIVEDRP
jgi:hypothetical protein